VAAVSKQIAVKEKTAVKLSRSCHINKMFCPKKVKLGLTNLILKCRWEGGKFVLGFGGGVGVFLYACLYTFLL